MKDTRYGLLGLTIILLALAVCAVCASLLNLGLGDDFVLYRLLHINRSWAIGLFGVSAAFLIPALPRQNQDYILFCIGVALAALSIFDIARITVLSSGLEWNWWGFSEWLINYASGIVRRGLAGELMQHYWPAETFVGRLNTVLFILFSTFCVGLSLLFLIAGGIHRSFLLLIAMPGSVLTMAAQGEMFYRKEMLFHVSLIALALLVCTVPREADDLHRRIVASVAVGLSVCAFIVLPLVHESFFLLTMPAYLYVLYVASVHLHSNVLRQICLPLIALAIVQLCVAAMLKGDPHMAQSIWASLPENLRSIVNSANPAAPRGAVEAVGWTSAQGLSLSLEVLRRGYAWYWIVPIVLAGLCAVIILDEITDKHFEARSGVVVAVVGIFACTAPTYILGWDWGRWISSAAISSVVSILVSVRTRTSLPVGWIIPVPFGRLMPILFWVSLAISLTLRTPECCMGRGSAGIFGAFEALR